MDLIEKLRKEREERRRQRELESAAHLDEETKKMEEERARRREERRKRREQVLSEVNSLRETVRETREEREKKVETVLKETTVDFDEEEFERRKREREAARLARAEEIRKEEEERQRQLQESRARREKARREREEEEARLEEEREKERERLRLEKEKEIQEMEERLRREHEEREAERKRLEEERVKEEEERQRQLEEQERLREAERLEREAQRKKEEKEHLKKIEEERKKVEEERQRREEERLRIEKETKEREEALQKEREALLEKQRLINLQKEEEERKEREAEAARKAEEERKRKELQEKLRLEREAELERAHARAEAEKKRLEAEAEKRRQEELKRKEELKEAKRLEQECLEKEERERVQRENEIREQKKRELELLRQREEEERRVEEERRKEEQRKRELERERELQVQREKQAKEEQERKLRLEAEKEAARLKREKEIEEAKMREIEAEREAKRKREQLEIERLEREKREREEELQRQKALEDQRKREAEARRLQKEKEEAQERERQLERQRRMEQQKLEREKKLEEQRLEREAEMRRIEQERRERERAEERKRLEREREDIEKKRLEREKIESERDAEQDKLEQERSEQKDDQSNTSTTTGGRAAFMAQLEGKLSQGPVSPAPKITVTPTQPDKSAFMAQLAGKIGAGPPKKVQPKIDSDGSNRKLIHLTKNRAKGPNRNRQASVNPIRNRPGAYTTDESSTKTTNTTSTNLKVETTQKKPRVSAPASTNPASRKKLPPGAVPGGLGGLIAGLGTISQDMLKSRTPLIRARKKGFDRKLVKIVGSRPVMVTRVDITAESLNENGVFILDDNDSIFVWRGRSAGKMAVTNAAEIATRFNRENHGSSAAVLNLRSGTESDKFWDAIGGKTKPSTDIDLDYETAEYEVNVQLYVYESVIAELVPVDGPRKRKLLNTNKCYVLDANTEFYVWNGKKAPMDLRDECYIIAEEKFNEKSRPEWCSIERQAEEGECVLFTSKFVSWPSLATLSGADSVVSPGNIAKKKDNAEKQDVLKMYYQSPPIRWEDVQKDNGKDGPVRIWYIDNKDKVILDESEHGQFYSDKSYIAMYNYGNYERYMIYFWQGKDASIADKGTAAGITMDINNRFCKGAADTIRVQQYSESEHFHQLFSPFYISYDVKEDGPVKLFHVRGKNDKTIATHQIKPRACQLHSEDCFILKTESEVIVWTGKYSCEYVQNSTQEVLPTLAGDLSVTFLKEGEEDNSFWSLLGGKDIYVDQPLSEHIFVFDCSDALGYFKCSKLFEWSIETLAPSKIILIDTFQQVYLWIGPKSEVFVRKEALEISKEYVEKAPDDRPRNSPMYIFGGSEPIEFQRLFHGFQIHDEMGTDRGDVDELLESYSTSFTYEQLLDRDSLPETVDKTRLQDYLSEEEFGTVFGMSREEFEALAKWKQSNKRKEVKLF
eukprot:TRINITY_DN4047_c0_g1_i1.p1 TRINITY_DN4047_c0_g1~~TRINITY_DN4047_c0_g1_i1.p1  ORF type:complete len:1420 (-),score=449.34 TRINITY_DN4047_c0_g1_i1:41-4300(-)